MAANFAEVIHLRRTNRPLPQINLATISLKEVKEIEQELRQSTIKARWRFPDWIPNAWIPCFRPRWSFAV